MLVTSSSRQNYLICFQAPHRYPITFSNWSQVFWFFCCKNCIQGTIMWMKLYFCWSKWLVIFIFYALPPEVMRKNDLFFLVFLAIPAITIFLRLASNDFSSQYVAASQLLPTNHKSKITKTIFQWSSQDWMTSRMLYIRSALYCIVAHYSFFKYSCFL